MSPSPEFLGLPHAFPIPPDDPPPSYTGGPGSSTPHTTTNELPTPPGYSLPLRTHPIEYQIGSRKLQTPLVNVEQLKAHLSLLGAFAELRRKVEIEYMDLPEWNYSMPNDPKRRWGWFIGIAVERFERWCMTFPSTSDESPIYVGRDDLPPLDVMMVWHAYLLNPRWYAEDCERNLRLRELRSGFGPQLISILLENGREVFQEPPNYDRLRNWTSRTGLAWEALSCGEQLLKKHILCPQCRRQVTVDLTNQEGTGYIQQFSAVCVSQICNGFGITKETLGVRRLATDLASQSSSLAGAIYYADGGRQQSRGTRVKEQIYNAWNRTRPPQFGIVANYFAQEVMKYSHGVASQKLALALSEQNIRLRFRIMCAYTDDKPFSLDLVGAVLRQSSFIQKMVDLGWANIGYFDNPEDALVLQHAIARYHAFLDLIWSSPASFFVPTLDIDLAWHTHQLMSSKYERDCMEHVGRFVDHDDKVEETGLASGFDSTFRAWQDRFGLRYAYCGCPMPGETIGQKLSRLIQHDRDSSGSQDIPSLLLPVSNRDDSMLATHPSDHNSVFAMHQRANAESSRRERKYKNTRRREREMERHKKEQGKKKKDKEKDSALAEVLSAAAELTSSWDPAFLTPVPYQSHPAAGCAGSCGNVVYGGSSGCAAGAGGCAGSAPGGNCGGGDLGGGGDYGSSGGGGDGSGGDGGGGGCGGGGN